MRPLHSLVEQALVFWYSVELIQSVSFVCVYSLQLSVFLLVDLKAMRQKQSLCLSANDHVPEVPVFLFSTQEAHRLKLKRLRIRKRVLMLYLYLEPYLFTSLAIVSQYINLVILDHLIHNREPIAVGGKPSHNDLFAPVIVTIVGCLDKLPGVILHKPYVAP